MKRYIAQFHQGGCPDRYVVVDTRLQEVLSAPKPYHEANDEAHARNEGTFSLEDLAIAKMLTG